MMRRRVSSPPERSPQSHAALNFTGPMHVYLSIGLVRAFHTSLTDPPSIIFQQLCSTDSLVCVCVSSSSSQLENFRLALQVLVDICFLLYIGSYSPTTQNNFTNLGQTDILFSAFHINRNVRCILADINIRVSSDGNEG